ncbi:hypothetical protein Trydic_g13751 [Trypoxylus dichotomus]
MRHLFMRDLPNETIEPARPFVNTSVDYCGPLLIRNGISKRAAKIKVCIAIFVCMVVKAVYIEIVKGVGSDPFIRALKRFIGRRAMPRGILSDNSTNFIKTNKDLKEQFGTQFRRPQDEPLISMATNRKVESAFLAAMIQRIPTAAAATYQVESTVWRESTHGPIGSGKGRQRSKAGFANG